MRNVRFACFRSPKGGRDHVKPPKMVTQVYVGTNQMQRVVIATALPG